MPILSIPTAIADAKLWVATEGSGSTYLWTDDFTTDNFTSGTNRYSLLAGTEGSTFTVAPNDLSVSSEVVWEDETTNQNLPNKAEVTFISGASTASGVAFGFADPTTGSNVLIVGWGVDFGGSVVIDGISATDPSDNFSITDSSYSVPDSGTFTLTIDNTGLLTVDFGAGTTSHMIPPAMVTAFNASGNFYPFVEIIGTADVSEWAYGNGTPVPGVQTLIPEVIVSPLTAHIRAIGGTPNTGGGGGDVGTQLYEFDGSLSHGSNRIVSYNWFFGDGTAGTGEIVAHRFLVPGTYLITLIVTDTSGRQDSQTQSITFSGGGAVVPNSWGGNPPTELAGAHMPVPALSKSSHFTIPTAIAGAINEATLGSFATTPSDASAFMYGIPPMIDILILVPGQNESWGAYFTTLNNAEINEFLSGYASDGTIHFILETGTTDIGYWNFPMVTSSGSSPNVLGIPPITVEMPYEYSTPLCASAGIFYVICEDSTPTYYVGRGMTDGSQYTPNLFALPHLPADMQTDGTYLYILYDDTHVGRCHLDGSGMNDSFIPAVTGNHGFNIGVWGSDIVFTEGDIVFGSSGLGGNIWHAPITGGTATMVNVNPLPNPSPGFFTTNNPFSPFGVCTDGNRIYYTTYNPHNSLISPSVVVSTQFGICDMDGSDNVNWDASDPFSNPGPLRKVTG